MKHYFIKEGDREFGPYSPEQLRSNRITKDTLIWKAGFTDWIAAGRVLELRDIFEKKYSSIPAAKNKIGKILSSNFPKQKVKRDS
jgi:hypothetical protein